jgi:iron complex outermembrane receptor protein
MLLSIGWSPANAETAAKKEEKEKTETEATSPSASGNTATDVFELGQITVYGKKDNAGGLGGQTLSQSTVTAADILNQNRNTLDEALRTTPGVESSNSGGARNERMIYVRGFDRWQVPLSIDGVRVYLPADNRIDYGRFLTPDLAEIQIHKGYASVLDGPGGMGGAINLVTRKPTRELEGELRATTEFGNTGDLAAHTLFGSMGTKQELYYLQASASLRDSDGYYLSRDYKPENIGNGGPVQGK